MQYRVDFLLEGLISIFWTFTALVPLFVVYGERPTIAGWSFGEALLVVGWFTLLQGVLEGAITPSLNGVVEHIRKGTLDFVLLKPADAQFLVSTTRFQPWRATNVLTGIAIFVYAFHLLGRGPSIPGAVRLGGAAGHQHAAALLAVDPHGERGLLRGAGGQPHLLLPVHLRRGALARRRSSRASLAFIFTFVVPAGADDDLPGAGDARDGCRSRALGAAVVGSIVFAFVARRVWRFSIGHYTSAGG